MATNAVLTLRSGLAVLERAIRLALELDGDGHALKLTPEGTLAVTHGATVTESQRRAIKRDKLHLLAIAGYDGPEPAWGPDDGSLDA